MENCTVIVCGVKLTKVSGRHFSLKEMENTVYEKRRGRVYPLSGRHFSLKEMETYEDDLVLLHSITPVRKALLSERDGNGADQ